MVRMNWDDAFLPYPLIDFVRWYWTRWELSLYESGLGKKKEGNKRKEKKKKRENGNEVSITCLVSVMRRNTCVASMHA